MNYHNFSTSNHLPGDTENQEMHLDDFDRECKLEDLLPTTVLDNLFAALCDPSSVDVIVVNPEGTPYYFKGSPEPGTRTAVSRFLREARPDSPLTIDTKRGTAGLFPIIHELEPIGYIVVWGAEDAQPVLGSPQQFGRFLTAVLGQLVIQSHRSVMTAGLHGQVVEESYRQISRKAEQLAKSEKKYRLLAENLEAEVTRQTQTIKEAQVQLIQQDKLASIGQLAAGVAHEINNPIGFVYSNLNTLRSYAEDIKSLMEDYKVFIAGLEKSACSESGCREIQREANRLCRHGSKIDIDFILDDLLNLIAESRYGAERIRKIVCDLKEFARPGEQGLRNVDVNHSLESSLNMIMNAFRQKAEITKAYGEVPQVRCHARELNQAFMNILMNAVQAIESRGTIRIATRAVGEQVEITISDSGVGIAGENLTRIFEPFFTTKPVGAGTGLGLNVAYNIIRKHHGTITVESEPNRGTTFVIKLPVE